MDVTLQALRDRIGGEIVGDPAICITGVSSLDHAKPGDLSFAEHERHLEAVRKTAASVILIKPDFPVVDGKNFLRVPNPREAFVMALVAIQPPRPAPAGIHPSAVISPEAVIEEPVTIGECCVVRKGAHIGRGTILASGVHVGEAAVIGRDCTIAANVVIGAGVQIGDRAIFHGGVVIGADGFGFVWNKDRYLKVPQLGTVIIGNDVEIGANSCVDRATFGATTIGDGTKIDNQVQVAHNDVIGKHVILAGQVGLAGSVTIRDRAMLGGKAGVIDHLTIGEGARTGAASIVTRSVKPGETVWGLPARPTDRILKELASLALLPKLLKTVRKQAEELERLARRIAELEAARKH
jgi:UDP-3-O-[3-hydroxymyristoyl] glucosamine N-acyltransferase